MRSRIFIRLVLSQHILQHFHCEEIWVRVSRSREKHSDIKVSHFIISHIHHGRCEIRFLGVFLLL